MICFPNAKINLGLQIALKRKDGFHNLRSVFYPVPIYDVLEFSEADKYSLTLWGTKINTTAENNLITKTWKMLSNKFSIPPQEVHLLKNIPVGSGLGGGSSDAVFFMKEMLAYYNIDVSNKVLLQMASELCSDCPFFINNHPAYVIGRGNVVEPIAFSLSGYYLIVIVPGKHISTNEAFKKIIPKAPEYNLKKLVLEKDFAGWRKTLLNDFESNMAMNLSGIKTNLYDAGALYASMTGSGSGFYGLFDKKEDAINAGDLFVDNLQDKVKKDFKLFICTIE